MHIVSYKAIDDFCEIHKEARKVMDEWHERVCEVQWWKFADMRSTFPTADALGDFTVFDIGGNNYRIIAVVRYARMSLKGHPETGRVYIRHVLTHAEYTRRFT